MIIKALVEIKVIPLPSPGRIRHDVKYKQVKKSQDEEMNQYRKVNFEIKIPNLIG